MVRRRFQSFDFSLPFTALDAFFQRTLTEFHHSWIPHLVSQCQTLLHISTREELARLPQATWAQWDIPHEMKYRLQQEMLHSAVPAPRRSPGSSGDSHHETSLSDPQNHVFGSSPMTPNESSNDSSSPPRKRIAVASASGVAPIPAIHSTPRHTPPTLTPNEIADALQWSGTHDTKNARQRLERKDNDADDDSRVPRRERARRQDMNEAIEQLKELVPHELGLKPTKSAVLWNSVGYIERLQKYCSELVAENKALRQQLELQLPGSAPSSSVPLPPTVGTSPPNVPTSPPQHHQQQQRAFPSLHPPPPTRPPTNSFATSTLFTLFVCAITVSSWTWLFPENDLANSRILLSYADGVNYHYVQQALPWIALFVYIYWLFTATCTRPSPVCPFSLLTPTTTAFRFDSSFCCFRSSSHSHAAYSRLCYQSQGRTRDE